MRPNFAAIWRRPPPALDLRIDECIRSGCENAEPMGRVDVFFRADDVGVPGMQFARMMGLFAKYGVPLSLAIVPAWLTPDRWQYLNGFEKNNPSRWCWYQHGWRHVNHEAVGKKQEFGDTRSLSEVKQDLIRGKNRLEQLLKDLGYAAVSRSLGRKPLSAGGLPDFYINVDLHTRKEQYPVIGWNNLLREFEQAIASGYCGIMIHHQMMNAAAFDFLEILLKALINHKKIQLVNFKDLVSQKVF